MFAGTGMASFCTRAAATKSCLQRPNPPETLSWLHLLPYCCRTCRFQSALSVFAAPEKLPRPPAPKGRPSCRAGRRERLAARAVRAGQGALARGAGGGGLCLGWHRYGQSASGTGRNARREGNRLPGGSQNGGALRLVSLLAAPVALSVRRLCPPTHAGRLCCARETAPPTRPLAGAKPQGGRVGETSLSRAAHAAKVRWLREPWAGWASAPGLTRAVKVRWKRRAELFGETHRPSGWAIQDRVPPKLVSWLDSWRPCWNMCRCQRALSVFVAAEKLSHPPAPVAAKAE